jgi:hypothetical protein
MKQILIAFPQMILILIGIIVYFIAYITKNFLFERALNKLNNIVFALDEWADK